MSEHPEIVVPDSELNAIIKEHLELNCFEKTCFAFIGECQEQNKIIGKTLLKKETEKVESVRGKLINLFESGSRDKFFELWSKHISEKLRTKNAICQKLEFILYIYFAIYPLVQGYVEKTKLEESMAYFKRFLETRGAALSQTTEFLPYYALPFIPNPRQHPSFQELFEESWVPDLKMKLEKFLCLTLKSTSNHSYLMEIHKKVLKEKEESNKKIQLIQKKLCESESKSTLYQKKFEKIRKDYENLIGITAELVDTLDATIRGNMVSTDYLKSVCLRLLPSDMQVSIENTVENITPGDAFRASIAQSLSRNVDVPLLPSLDYDKIKKDLISASDRSIILLLQALRWRLTKSLPGQQRNTVMTAYINYDLLGCLSSEEDFTIIQLLSSSNDGIKQYAARFVNAFASLAEGRLYIAQCPQLVLACLNSTKLETKESLTRENLLGALQKLSLRRHLQSLMIEHDTISWLIALLEDYDSLSDYTLEYATALLMNLCLRTAGRLKCALKASHVFKVVSDLLGSDRPEVVRFVNGTLYSILCVPSIREEAKAMGMEETLKCFLKESDYELRRQIHYVIKKLNSDDTDEASDDEDVEEDEDEENQDAMEADLDKNEIIIPKPGELIGEKLLNVDYLGFMTNSVGKRKNKQVDEPLEKDKPITRPITPKSRIQGNEISPLQIRTQSLSNIKNQNSPSGPTSPIHSHWSCPSTQKSSKDAVVADNVDKTPEESLSTLSSRAKSATIGDRAPNIKSPSQRQELHDYASPFSARPKVLRTPEPSFMNDPDDHLPVLVPSTSPPHSRSNPGSRPSSSALNRESIETHLPVLTNTASLHAMQSSME